MRGEGGMKPDLGITRPAWPEIDEGLLREHLARLGKPYFESFSEQDILRHLAGLAKLTGGHPVEVLVRPGDDERVECTVLAFDYPSEFSLITGILAGMGFNILTGDVFTYEKVLAETSKVSSQKKGGDTRAGRDSLGRRRIVDHFAGTLDTSLSFAAWAAEMRRNMEAVIGLLEDDSDRSVMEAKQHVNEMVIRRLTHLQAHRHTVLSPVHIEVDNESAPLTRLKVVSEDTPAFLYALSTALSLHGVLIERVRIRTVDGHIEDQIDLADLHGSKVEDEDTLDRLKLSVLLTKHFTYFLGKAPDPNRALSRFEHLLGDIFRQPSKGKWLELLTNPHALQHLAELLGASDFLWEDFIRLQYETLLPMLQHHGEDLRFCEPVETLSRRLKQALDEAQTPEEQRERLNYFKDREIYLFDLDQILNPEVDLRVFAERLTLLAENVVNMASELVYGHLVRQFGTPRTIGGLDAKFAILGLGKLGGAALGYASDIELLFVYGDSGRTDGASSIDNAEFFDRLVRGVIQFIRAKREGIFHVDVRLRPYGSAGPLACSLESFCNYYGQGGQAHPYERLALVRLRAIGGDAALGRRLERLRDEMIYASNSLDLQQLKDLREKQFHEHTKGGRLNAKFSPGGLVDLEYGVQILQVMHGGDFPELRTPRIHQALSALTGANILLKGEALGLVHAYDFLRRLINAMRMLRGSAKDLFLPSAESEELAHLARRMGYERGGPLKLEDQLRVDFETHTAMVRVFTGRYFGRDLLPGPGMGTVVDLVLSDTMPREVMHRTLRNGGFRDPDRAYVNLKGLAGDGIQRGTFARLALLALDVLARKPDPDMALNNWERFIGSLGSPGFHYNLLLSQPMRLEILLSIFSGSQFLADALIRNPGFFDWVMVPEILRDPRKREDMEADLRQALHGSRSHQEWLNRLRRFRRREILRIGTRDMSLMASSREVMFELSMLADVLVEIGLEAHWSRLRQEGKIMEGGRDPERDFCILAFGKLGGSELNYSSDIDLLGMWDDTPFAGENGTQDRIHLQRLFASVMEGFRSDLSSHTEEGYAYRVDLRLRPYGRAGELVPTLSGLVRYYREKASLWEVQAALKVRPVAGNLALGYRFLDAIRPVFLQQRRREHIVHSIEKMRSAAIKTSSRGHRKLTDVKSGLGGLRDVEFLVQGIQLVHAPKNPVLLEGNTLTALEILSEARILPRSSAAQLMEDYIFLRRVEHCLQILEDRQIHALPEDPAEMEALGKRVLGVKTNRDEFTEELNRCLTRIRSAYTTYLLEGKA